MPGVPKWTRLASCARCSTLPASAHQLKSPLSTLAPLRQRNRQAGRQGTAWREQPLVLVHQDRSLHYNTKWPTRGT